VPQALDAGALASGIGQQAAVLAVADAYRVLGLLALLLIPLVLQMNRVNPPGASATNTVPLSSSP
ncbi:MAG: MFS transporter, partial [Pseudomonadota bacterium]|nr:MFS transporter [Pseudomonadota bacterium]